MASAATTKQALLEQGALLYARHGVAGVSAKALHEAVGARNESALHYHFGSQAGLLEAILRAHLEEVERRRAAHAAEIEARGETSDVRALVRALAAPMVEDLHDPVGRAHLRIVAQVSHPALAYEDAFRSARAVDVDAAAGTAIVTWLQAALTHLPPAVRRERLVDLRGHLIAALAHRAQLVDDDPEGRPPHTELFLENLLDVLVAGLTAPPSEATLAASRRRPRRPAG